MEENSRDETQGVFRIETFENKYPHRPYTITITNAEFTSVCPITGLPDFGTITVNYIPAEKCIELKSLKYYFIEYRNIGVFYEAVVNKILDDLVAACDPAGMEVVGEFSTRGGMRSVVKAKYEKARRNRGKSD
ncbi:MAG: preQ(1) synthase [Syntrophales bacterium]